MKGVQHWTTEIEKQVGYRVQTVLDDPVLLKAYQSFGAAVLRRSSVFHGLGKFLAENNVNGKRCFEIGTWNGLTAAVLSRHFDEVVTVDIAHNNIKHQLLAELGIGNVRCIDIANNDEKRRIAAKLEFDFAYLDGNHADDTMSDWQITKKCGRVLFHECWPFQPKVFALAQSLPQNEMTYNGMGLALWTRDVR